MNLQENLKIERYKLVVNRQKYFTELARTTFNSYIKIFIYLVAGGIALISAKSILEIDPQLLRKLIRIILVLAYIIAIVSIIQIGFCLWRWYGFRRAEIEINPDSPPIKKLAWIFEGLYIFIIIITLIVICRGASQIDSIVKKLQPQQKQTQTTQSIEPVK